MKVLVDTHALVWWVTGDLTRLGAACRKAISAEQADGGIRISSISAWEIAMLVSRGRLGLNADVTTWLSTVGAIGGVGFVPVDNRIAVGAVNLPGEFHRDPADRIIAATARVLDAAVITGDEKLRAYSHIRTIW